VNAIQAFSAMGGPSDSLVALEQAADAAFQLGMVGSASERARHLALSAILAFPAHTFRTLDYDQLRFPTGQARAALIKGDSSGARSILAADRDRREKRGQRGISIDVLYAEAALLVALGQRELASSALDGNLPSLASLQPGALERPGRSGALVRAMALRAQIAHDLGEAETARRWARLVLSLWRGGEPAVDVVIDQMNRLL
jgi:hypothetical protein